MIRLLQLLFLGHFHKWKIIQKNPVDYTSHGQITATGDRYVLQCESCGKLKVFNTHKAW